MCVPGGGGGTRTRSCARQPWLRGPRHSVLVLQPFLLNQRHGAWVCACVRACVWGVAVVVTAVTFRHIGVRRVDGTTTAVYGVSET